MFLVRMFQFRIVQYASASGVSQNNGLHLARSDGVVVTACFNQ